MQSLMIILLLILVGVFIALYIFYRREITDMTTNLKNINSTDTNSKISLSTSNRFLQDLAKEINISLGQKQNIKNEYKKIDLELRQAITNMSHDLRTPLTSIMGYIQLIEDNNLSEREKKRYVDIIKKRAKALEVQISSFYDFSRLESNEYQFNLKSVNLSSIMIDTIASYYNDFINKGIEPIIDIKEKIPFIIADEKAAGRIFSNLIQNMIKYGENFVRIELKQYDNYIQTSFENDTKDLTEEFVPRLFDRFFTVNTTRNDSSTGLGLAITKEFVEQMGHSIKAELIEDNLKIIIRWKVS